MASDAQKSSRRRNTVIIAALTLLVVFWVLFAMGRVLLGAAPWGPRIGGRLPHGTEVFFQARRVHPIETDDRLTVVAPGMAPRHYWVDRVHGGFGHVVLKYNQTGSQLWVESDGKVGASMDLTTSDFRAEGDEQHEWAQYGTGITLDSGNTSSLLVLLRPW
jgi:hypothetical protein